MTPTINSKKSTKASGRQTNNSLSSISENIFIENNQNSKSKSNNSKQSNNTSDSLSAKDKDKDKDKDAKKSKVLSTGGKTNVKTEKKNARSGNPTKGKQKASSSSVLTETEEVLQIGMHKVLEHVKNHKDAWPFMDPVEEDIAPRYYSIIRRPMDLLKMEERLDNGQYLSFTDFRNDFKLIVNNCRLYNGQNNEYTEMVNNLQHAFEKSTKKYFEQNSSDEDGDLEYPDLKTNVFREKSNAKNSITPKIKEIIGSKGLTSKTSTMGGKKIANSSSTPEKSTTNKEKPAEINRDRKRKQKFKDKRKSDKTDKLEGLNGVSDNDEKNDHSVVSDIEMDDGLDDDEEELEIIPAKKSRKMEKPDRIVDVQKPKKVDKAKNSKKFKKVIEKKSPKELNVKRSKRKIEVKDDKTGDIELEPEVEQIKKKKKSKATEDVKEETVKKSSSGQGNKKEVKEPKDLKETRDLKETKELKTVKESKDESNDLKKSNKKRKTQEIIDTYEFSDQDESPIKEKKLAKGKKLNKKTNKQNSSKEKLSDKKAKNGKQRKKTGKKKAPTIENEAKDIDEDDDKKSQSSHSSSTSVSPIKFTVDLHAKYSKSASNTSINKIERSISAESRSSSKLARSPSPTLSQYSSNEDSNSTSVKDKFDLIKERRGRSTNNDDKWKQIVKNAEKIKDKNKSTSTDGPKVQEKNQKLKETIEKLKQKNKQSKKLLNKLSDAKPSNVTKNDEKNAFDLLKESKPLKTKSKSKDDLAILEAESIGLDISDSKKSPNKKQKEKGSKVQKRSLKNAGNITNPNIEALELETEQTLKDINRWLEHTPRFSEFHSASNSPTRFNNLLDDFDTVTSKLDPADFRRPLPITNDTAPVTFVAEQLKAAATASPSTTQKSPQTKLSSDSLSSFATSKENKPKQTIQLTGIPPPPGPHKRDKEPKRKSLKEKISAMIPKRKEIHRTIERLQPGKTKGNLIGTIAKPEEVSILGTSNTNKQKDVKSSAVPEVEDSGPKLSLGTVLNTAGFGLIQQHNFADNENTKDEDLLCDSASKDACSDDMELEEIVTSTEQLAREKERKEKEEKEKSTKKQQSPGDKSATPNLNAWLKAFGVPKKQKKSDEDDADKVKKTDKFATSIESQTLNSLSKTNSPLASSEQSCSQIPAQRTRKASTGSTVSERSSYSQDPDSPRIGIDERICGSYPAPYPSPLGASPIMTSPKDDLIKPTSPYPLPNGAIRVGFYQDTTTKSSPEKSCSPREQPSASPYSNYAQHLYVSTTTSGSSNSYSSMAYTSPAKVNQNAPLGFNNKNKTPSYFDQYKQPKSQDSDYNSSVGSDPNSPYQSQHSPYQSDNSPYQQSQTSPYTQQPNSIQSNASSTQQINPNSPNSPYAAPNSPYQNQQLSPYQDVQQQHSPYASSNNPTGTQDNAQTTASSTNYHSNPSSPLAYSQSDVHGQHLTNLPKTSPQAAVIHQQQTSVPHINSSMSALSPTPQPLDTKTAPNPIQYNLQSSYTNHQHYVNLADPPAPSVINSSSSLQTDKPKPDEEQRDILNLDYQKQTNKTSLNIKASDHPLSISDPLNKPHGYDHVFEPMGFNKSYDISSTKAIEMFNRAATMSFSKTFPTPLSVGNKSENNDLNNLSNRTSSASLLNTYQHPSMHSNYSLYSLDNKATSHLGYNSHELDIQAQQVQQSDPLAKHGLYGTDMSSALPSVISNDNRIKSNELNVPTIPPHRYDVPSYDPRNMIHPLIDDNMNGSNCYYPSKEHPSQSLYGKSVLPTQSQTSSAADLPQSNPYNMTREHQQQLSAPAPNLPQVTEPKPKRTRKKKNTVEPTPVSQPPVIVNNHQMIQQHNLGWNALDANAHSNTVSQIPSQPPSAAHSSLLNQSQHSLQPVHSQGFQSYTALKPSSQSNALGKNTPTSEATAISLKTNSIVPGSAFNFGPTTSGSLAGLYGENPSYLEDYRASANPYYLQTHRPTAQPDQSAEANAASTGPPATSYVTTSRGTSSPAPPTYHQFLPPHHPYTNSQFYQQYLRTEEYRQRMMFANQGLLPHGSPTGYPQPGYHPLGMHKPYGW